MEIYYFYCNIDKKICSLCIQYIMLSCLLRVVQMIYVDIRICIKQVYLEFYVIVVLIVMRVEVYV